MNTQTTTIDPTTMLKPRRKLTGISAILLPLTSDHQIDEDSLCAHIARTAEHGLIPAVNMDTGYVHLIDDDWRRRVLEITKETLGGGPFVAGAFVKDNSGDSFNRDEYARQMGMIEEHGGTPVIFQSFGLIEQDGDTIVESYQQIADSCDKFIGFELTKELAPFGSVYDLKTYSGLMEIQKCIGAKHSSFQREPEWQRLQLRNANRPDFKVFTGNDFAIDMVQYGSDYLLGLSTFAPDLFAKRDAYWEQGDAAFYELNDLLQYLGFFAFRSPGPGYKHSAAQFLNLRGWCKTNETHPDSPQRPESDIAVLKELGERLGVL
ncbi:dihydrodipicolinate synthase family protein [Planctomycetaceae bacterium]|nr:dihydrodipicolinate synthase family protein [bacterium]MDC0262114.1 dihydrodipicolinate synthase family protein [Planctomycetaceae bacterium]MDC0307946.1 dihydrodipicolinate synthase family protein [Planctomycetaceae bacterium]